MVQVQPTRTNSSLESHQRQLVDGSSPTYTRTNSALESHQRQLVDCSSPAYSSLFLPSVGFTLCRMQVAPFTNLNWAYQLHYYICFRTHRRRECFAEDRNAETLVASLAEICQRHDYHLLTEQGLSRSRSVSAQGGVQSKWSPPQFKPSRRAPLSIVKQYLHQQSAASRLR